MQVNWGSYRLAHRHRPLRYFYCKASVCPRSFIEHFRHSSSDRIRRYRLLSFCPKELLTAESTQACSRLLLQQLHGARRSYNLTLTHIGSRIYRQWWPKAVVVQTSTPRRVADDLRFRLSARSHAHRSRRHAGGTVHCLNDALNMQCMVYRRNATSSWTMHGPLAVSSSSSASCWQGLYTCSVGRPTRHASIGKHTTTVTRLGGNRSRALYLVMMSPILHRVVRRRRRVNRYYICNQRSWRVQSVQWTSRPTMGRARRPAAVAWSVFIEEESSCIAWQIIYLLNLLLLRFDGIHQQLLLSPSSLVLF